MSASNKKKLRKEQNANVLSEKQRQQQSEAKKLKRYTIGFVCAMVLIVCAAIGILAVRAVNNSGIIQKNTIAAIVGDKKLSSVEMSYYYVDAVDKFYNEYSGYLSAFGLEGSVALDKQKYDEETGETWAEYFLGSALEQATHDYAMYEAAVKAGYELPEEEQESLDAFLDNQQVYAVLSGCENAAQYLRYKYGYGAEMSSYRKYMERSTIASSYYSTYADTLTYDEDDIRGYDEEHTINFNSYDYTTCYLSYFDFREGGTKGEDGKMTYTEAEDNAARAAMKEFAETLATATSKEELEEMVEASELPEGNEVEVTENKNVLYSKLTASSSELCEWVTSKDRKEGEVGSVVISSTTKDAEGNETTVENGYYIVIYNGCSDNNITIGDVRHLLVAFEGGEENEETGETEYSDEEKEKAKTAAEKYLAEWKEGDATEDTFIALVQEYSDDSSAEDGGLFENVAPDGTYVESFQNWVLDEAREVGDTEVIESPYGYHVMYYVGDSELSYRDYMIVEEMRSNDFEDWYNALIEELPSSLRNTSKMTLGLILGDEKSE